MSFICLELLKSYNEDPYQLLMTETVEESDYIINDDGMRLDKYLVRKSPREKIHKTINYMSTNAKSLIGKKAALNKTYSISGLATALGIPITNNWTDAVNWSWKFKGISELESAYFYTVLTDSGIKFMAPRRTSGSKEIAIHEEDILLQTIIDGTVKWLGETNTADYTINPIGDEPAMPITITAAEKKLALDKWISKTNIITFESTENIVFGDWFIYDKVVYIILSQLKNGTKTAYKAVKECNQTYTITTANIETMGPQKNILINGNLKVWQRGTSGFTTTAKYTADRWYLDFTNSVPTTVSQQASGINGSAYGIRAQKTAASATNGVIRLSQSLESVDSIPLRGKALTITLWAKAGANFSATGGILNCKIVTGTGTDQNLALPYTGAVEILDGQAVLTTTYKKIIFTTPIIADTVTEIGISFSYTTVGTASTNDWFEISQIQCNEGYQSAILENESYDVTYKKCLRYYHRATSVGGGAYSVLSHALMPISATRVFSPYKLPSRMRITPIYGSSGNLALQKSDGSSLAISSVATNAGFNNTDYYFFDITSASGLITGGSTYMISNNNNTAWIEFNADL